MTRVAGCDVEPHRNLPDERARSRFHRRLARYFEGQALGPRKLRELPSQLEQTCAWAEQAQLSADSAFFVAFDRSAPFEFRRAWAAVEANSDTKIVNAYQEHIGHSDSHSPEPLYQIAGLLNDTGHLTELQLSTNTGSRPASDRLTDYGAVSVFGVPLPPSTRRSASTSLSRW